MPHFSVESDFVKWCAWCEKHVHQSYVLHWIQKIKFGEKIYSIAVDVFGDFKEKEVILKILRMICGKIGLWGNIDYIEDFDRFSKDEKNKHRISHLLEDLFTKFRIQNIDN